MQRLKTVPGVGPIPALSWALEIGDASRFRSIRPAIVVEAAKLAPRPDHDLALVYPREKEKGNAHRATLAVARKMVAYLLAVDREQRDFVPAEDHRRAAA